MTLDYEGQSIDLDKEGFLRNLTDWNEAIAVLLAERDAIALSEAHWEIIHLVRSFYQEYELSPAMRPMVKYTAQQLGKDKGNSIYLLQLFPGSPARLANKIAGLPKPDNCL